MEEMRFKVGDKVRIRSKKWCEKYCEYSGQIGIAADTAKPYAGQVATIMYVDEDVQYYEVDVDNRFGLWYDEAFESLAGTPVDELKEKIHKIIDKDYNFKTSVEVCPEDLIEERTDFSEILEDAYEMYYMLENIADVLED